MTFDLNSDKLASIQSEESPIEQYPLEKIPISSSQICSENAGPSTASKVVESEVTYPEGGFEAWLVVFGSWSGIVASFGFMNSRKFRNCCSFNVLATCSQLVVAVFQEYLSRNQLVGYSESTIGWIFSVYIFLSFGCGFWIGPIFDAKGPRILLLAGSICLVAGTGLLSVSTKYWQIMLTVGVLPGLGTSLIFTPCFGAVGHFFFERRGFATGVASMGGSLGGIIFSLMLEQLFPQLGFAWAMRVLALIFLILCGICVLLVHSRLPPKPGSNMRPDLRIFRQPAFALTTVGVFFNEWALFTPVTYIASFIVATGAVKADSSLPFALVAGLNAGSCIGRVFPGLVADRIGRFNCMIIMLLFCISTNFGLWLPASILSNSPEVVQALSISYVVLFGIASGSNISLTPVCVGQLCETQEYGRYYATCFTIVSIGSLTGIPIAGAMLQASGGGYYGVVLFTGLCYVVSFVAFNGARWCKVGWRITLF
jgi:MFS family permease